MKSLNQKGIGAVLIVLIVVIFLVVGFAGWKIYESQNDSSDDVSSNTQTELQDEAQIKNSDDLTQEEADLDNQDIDKSIDTSDIDASLE